MKNVYINAAMAKKIAKDESLPFPLKKRESVLLKTGAKLFKHYNGRYYIGGYAASGKDVDFYL